MNTKVAIIGAGRVGGAIGHLLRKSGFNIVAVVCRTLTSAEKARTFIGAGSPMTDAAKAAAAADIVFITTPDGAIRSVCERIGAGRGFQPGGVVVHTSGAHTLDLLDSVKEAGALRAVVHPLQSVPSSEQGARNLAGSYFRVEADPEALQTARDIVRAIGGIELAMPKWRSDSQSAALYHAGAVAVSNYFVALVDYGLRFYEELGADRQEALRAVLPLIKGTLANVEAMGTTQALTGPIARGDAETVRGHIEAMERRAPELLPLYRMLAKQTIAIARDRGLPQEKLQELLTLVNGS